MLNFFVYPVQNDPFPTELDDGDHTLAYFGVPDGAEILMNEIDVEAREREKARLAADHFRRVEEQEQHVAVIQSMQKKEKHVNLASTEMSHKRTQ